MTTIGRVIFVTIYIGTFLIGESEMGILYYVYIFIVYYFKIKNSYGIMCN